MSDYEIVRGLIESTLEVRRANGSSVSDPKQERHLVEMAVWDLLREFDPHETIWGTF